MYRIKRAKSNSKKSSPFFAFVPNGSLLVAILTSPKSIVDRFRQNHRDAKKIYRINNN